MLVIETISIELDSLISDLNKTNLPKPSDLFAVAIVMAIDCVSLPVFDIDLLHSAQHQFQFTFVKVFQPFQWDHFVETFQECSCLLFDASVWVKTMRLKFNFR